MRWGKPTKNKKRRDPRYFLKENVEEENLQEVDPFGVGTIIDKIVAPLADAGAKKAAELVKQRRHNMEAAEGQYRAQAEVELLLAWVKRNPGRDPGDPAFGINMDDPKVEKIISKRQKDLLRQGRRGLPSAKELGR